ncbi:MAG: DUF423 domain-containing protein [Chitinophagaceae bacterium]|nr:DUF423 domain-containing protein [Chitinophagaceae bacterium]
MYRQALVSGALLAALAVILGAFGAHALKALVTPEKLLVFETGVRYHFYHSLALLATGSIYSHFPAKQLRLSTGLFITGIALFSGSLYAMVFVSINGGSLGPLGIITPIGGLFFIAAWIMLALGIAGAKK